MARKKKQREAEVLAEVAELESFIEEAPEAPEAPKAERSARVSPVAKSEGAEAKAYPTDPVSNPGFDDGTTLRDGTDVTAIPTGDGTTVDASGTYTANLAEIQGAPAPVLSVTPYLDPVNPTPAELVTRAAEIQAFDDAMAAFNAIVLEATQRSVALGDEQSYDPYERNHAV